MDKQQDVAVSGPNDEVVPLTDVVERVSVSERVLRYWARHGQLEGAVERDRVWYLPCKTVKDLLTKYGREILGLIAAIFTWGAVTAGSCLLPASPTAFPGYWADHIDVQLLPETRDKLGHFKPDADSLIDRYADPRTNWG